MESATVVPSCATWLLSDDVLLRNSVEEGASLEALAKGAVHFSHPFSFQEVHDRWHTLLYNPDISTKACSHLFTDESDKPKEISSSHRKRKVGTLRKRYYARLKRIRNDFFSSADLGFLTESNLHSCTANRGGFHEQGTLHDGPQVGNAMLGDCMPDPFVLEKTGFDILQQDFPQVLSDLAATNGISNGGDAVHPEGPYSLVNNQSSETAKNSSWHGLPAAVSTFSVQGSVRIDGTPPFQSKNNGCNDDILHSLQANSTVGGKILLPGEELSNTNTYTMGYSPLPNMPLWKTIEDIAGPDMPVNMENAQTVSEAPGNDDSKSKREDEISCDSFINAASISDGDFADLPDSLFDFSNGDMLFMDVDGKYLVDKSYCYNALSVLPMDTDDIDTYEVKEKAMIVANFAIVTEPEVATSHIHTVMGEEKHSPHVKVQKASTSTLNNKPLEHSEDKLYCVLNTEDPEIPCNDDIFLLIHPDALCASSAMISISRSAMDPVYVKEINIVRGPKSGDKSEELTQSSKPSLMFCSYMLPETGQIHTDGGPSVRAESNGICDDLALKHNTVDHSTQCKPAQSNLASHAEANLDNNVKQVDSAGVATPALLKELPLHTETGPAETTYPESVVIPSTSDHERPESEIDDPHFSDIEAMILEMDLGSYDEDLHFTRQVSRYQQETSKRTIIRLEQCARASIQRAMTSRGALAVLYGRHSRHFIRKIEVILGRSTEDTVVDIDLGKEGRHNKISRYQAIVKMKDDGSFSLKNLAKNPMLVNGAEVGSGKLIALSPSCLIEIRGISFVFESNQSYVNRYLKNVGKKNQGQMAKFEWLEDGSIS